MQLLSDHRTSSETIQQQVEDIISAKALGKSDAYARLLRFLADRAHTKKSVKEIEIAIEVFGRDETFDVTQDSLVRVYIHKLRSKLSAYYDKNPGKHSHQLNIPKGSYLLSLIEVKPSSNTAKTASFLQPHRIALVAVSLILGALIYAGIDYSKAQSEQQSRAIHSDIWAPLNSTQIAHGQKPILVVIGDVFVFSEVTEEYEQLREVRDFAISSSEDFSQRQQADPDFNQTHRDFGVRYLPSSIAPSLKHLGEFLGPDLDWQIRSASQLLDSDLTKFNIIYLGYHQGLAQFGDSAISDSQLQLHPNGSVLINTGSGEIFAGEGQVTPGYRGRYLDYGVLRKVELESGSSLFALTSARDAGLAMLAEFVFSKEGTEEIASQLQNPQAEFELLLEVSGSEATDLISQIRAIQQGL